MSRQCSDLGGGISCHIPLFIIQYTSVVQEHQPLEPYSSFHRLRGRLVYDTLFSLMGLVLLEDRNGGVLFALCDCKGIDFQLFYSLIYR